jgi:acetyl esterase/lipase
MRIFVRLITLLCGGLFLLAPQIAAGAAPTPPAPPTTGPGGSDYSFGDITAHRYGDGDSEYWIFEPTKPTPKSAPVIIFNHGWSAMSPDTYGAWIKHLVRRGNIVIFPRYQASMRTPMKDFTPNAVAAIKTAMKELQNNSHVQPELDHVAVVGHSMGGAITPSMAALAAAEGLPIPKAICCVEPGNHVIDAPNINMPLADLSKISPDTLALVIIGDRDKMVGDDTAKSIYAGIKQIPAANKDFITLISDEHGNPPLLGTHMAPVAAEVIVPNDAANAKPFAQKMRERMEANTVDAMDFYGTWKLLDGLTDAAFFGKNRQYALGNTPQQRYMGQWSDGTPVKELKIGP